MAALTDRTFFLLDVFAEAPCAGNQLAVFPRAFGVTGRRMQQLAGELNFSETAFVTAHPADPTAGAFPTRIFTPRRELPFAGHPTLGTAALLGQLLAPDAEEIRLAPPLGEIPVRFSEEAGELFGTMTQQAPQYGATVDRAAAAAALGVSPDDLHPELPPQKVSTGVEFLLVPFREPRGVTRAALDPTGYRLLVERHQIGAVFFFALAAERPENDVHARMFAPDFGVPEDPATGSASGCLAAYLLEHRALGDGDVDVRIEQGHEMGRPSLLRSSARRRGDRIVIEVGGRALVVARGEWLRGA